MNVKVKWITQTGILLAMLVVVQLVTKSIGQIVTGSLVNLILAIATLVGGLTCGITLSVISPIIAFILGIGPAFLPIVPCICAGNAVLCLILWHVSKKVRINSKPLRSIISIISIISASVCKFGVLYILVVLIVLPLLGLEEAKAAVISLSFSWTQLITALIGSSIAVTISPLILKGINNASKSK